MCCNNTNRNKYVKCYIVIVAIVLVFFACHFSFNQTAVNKVAYAEEESSQSIEEELEEQVENIFNDLDLSELEAYFESNAEYLSQTFNISSYSQLLQAIVRGEILTDFSSIFSAITGSVKSNIKSLLSPILLILTIILISVVFKSIRPTVADNSVGEAVFFISYSLIITILAYLFSSVFQSVVSTISGMQKHTQATFPILLMLMQTTGGVASIKAYQPMVLVLSNIVSNVFTNFLLPLVVVVFVLGIVGNLSPKNKLNKLTDFFYSLFKWTIGIVFTIYMGFMAIQGITAGVTDGIRIKTAKYAIKNYVPLLGGYISEGFEVARVGSLVIKNALGFSGIILLIISVLSPILLIATVELILKFVSGVVEPISDSHSVSLLSVTDKSLNMLLVTTIGVFMMYFVSLVLLVCSMSGVAL